MPIYLCSTVGTGTKKDPIRPPFSDVGSGWISLLPPGSTSGKGILYLPNAQVDARLIKIAEDPTETTSSNGRLILGNALGITFDTARGLRFADIMANALMDQGNRTSRWGGIRGFPSKQRQCHEIWLGALGRIWDEVTAPSPSTKVFNETWPTNGTTISTGQNLPWTEEFGDLEVSGGVIRATAVAIEANARCDAALDTGNQRHLASFTLLTPSVEGSVTGVHVREVDQDNFYSLDMVHVAGGTFERNLFKVIATVRTDLTSDATNPGSSGTQEVIADGSTVTGQMNGAIILGPLTEGTPDLTSARNGGLYITNGDGTATNATLDNHVIRDILPNSLPALGVG